MERVDIRFGKGHEPIDVMWTLGPDIPRTREEWSRLNRIYGGATNLTVGMTSENCCCSLTFDCVLWICCCEIEKAMEERGQRRRRSPCTYLPIKWRVRSRELEVRTEDPYTSIRASDSLGNKNKLSCTSHRQPTFCDMAQQSRMPGRRQRYQNNSQVNIVVLVF